MIALVDGDILLYRIGHTTVNDPEEIARIRTDDLMDSILVETKATEYEVWLSDNKEGNFRFSLWPEYKANRIQPRPLHYEFIKEHLVKEWGARFAYGMEADDALGIQSQKIRVGTADSDINALINSGDCVICSIDKDLLQIPGHHWNFVRKEHCRVSAWEGLQWFYKQILIGDTSDNVRGCRGIGPVKAAKAIDPIPQSSGEIQLYRQVHALYQKQEAETRSPEGIVEHIRLVGRLLKIKQQEDEELWDIPKSLPIMTKCTSSSTPSQPEVPIQFTEPTMLAAASGSSLLGEPTAATSRAKPPASTSQGR